MTNPGNIEIEVPAPGAVSIQNRSSFLNTFSNERIRS
jgi:hypothetical protein